MMQCPACSAPLLSGEARCVSCHALVNPQGQGSSALAPRLVTPQSLEGIMAPPGPAVPANESPKSNVSSSASSSDDAWRREVLERVRKRRQLRSHALPLFVEGPTSPTPDTSVSAPTPSSGTYAPQAPTPAAPQVPLSAYSLDESVLEVAPDAFESADPRPAESAPDVLASIDAPLFGSGDDIFDLPMRPSEGEATTPARAKATELPSQSLVERPRPTLVTAPVGNRSLVGDLPLVEPSQSPEAASDVAPRRAAARSKVASMNDRFQAALIDLGMWSAMSVTAFYFASRIARTPLLGLGAAWQGLSLFGVVLAAAYILFFGGLSGATPGKIACGIQVRRYDGSSLGPLASLARGVIGILGVVLLGAGVWPAFWDKDRRTLHDRLTDSRVTTV